MNHSKTVLEEKLRKRVEEYRPQIIDILSKLIAIPTANPPGQSYRECVDFLSAMLKKRRIEHSLISVPDVHYPRFSIVGGLGEGSETVHFHGHYDVVPAASEQQFNPVLKEDCLYGRGSSDMKSGLVALLFALFIIKDFKMKLKGKLTFSLVPDEETGGRWGTQHLVESGYLPKSRLGMLMPEPTSGAIWNANKGALTYKVEIKGKYAHVGLEPRGVNAFEQMVQVAHSLLKLKKNIQRRKTEMEVNPPEANRSVMLIGGESGSGLSFNVVPDKAFFTLDRRINPEENLEEAKKELDEIFDEHRRQGIKIKALILQEGDSSAGSPQTPLASALSRSIEDITGKAPLFKLCPGLCEIRFFNKRDTPAYAYGPGLLETSHGPEEYVKISDVLDCTMVYALTALRSLT